MKPVIFFDWDGTLADSMNLCVAEIRQALITMHLPDLPDDVLRQCNGPTFEQSLDILHIPHDRAQEYMTTRLTAELALVPTVNRLFPGVREWFGRINAFGAQLGVTVEHYVISSGLREIIEGSGISHEFREIYACEFFYDENGLASWPKLDVNFTNKTQFVYRINKGILDVARDKELNASMPDDSKRVPFRNMIYIGDGLSDVPCMKMMRAYGGQAIAVYQEDNRAGVEDLLSKGRVDFIFPADYRAGMGLDTTVQNIIRKMTITDALAEENARQFRQIGKSGLPYQASLFE